MGKSGREPVPGTDRIIEEYNSDLYVMSREYTDGTFDVWLKQFGFPGTVGYSGITADSGDFFEHPYLRWGFALERPVKKSGDREFERNSGFIDVKEGRRLAYAGRFFVNAETNTISPENAVKALERKYGGEDIEFLTECRFIDESDFMMEDVQSERKSFNIVAVSCRKGRLSDYFNLDDICAAYRNSGMEDACYGIFYEKLNVLFSREIKDICSEHFRQWDDTPDENGENRTYAFSFDPQLCTPLHSIIRGLLLGFPVEVTAYELNHPKRMPRARLSRKLTEKEIASMGETPEEDG